jgi:hypothetical protein
LDLFYYPQRLKVVVAAIHICMAAGDDQHSKYDIFYNQIQQRSLFTDRQMSIIYKRMARHHPRENISAGAYYRQLKQCRIKIKSALYSILMLRLCGAIDGEAINTLDRIAQQLDVMSQALGHGDATTIPNTQEITAVINKLIDAMCKV